MSSLEERREARRRRRGADDDEAPAEEDTSSRRGRRRGTEDETAAEETSAPAEDDSSAREEEERRRREEQEAAEAERQRQEADKRRRQEEERRQQEEKRRKQEEEERRKAEEREERERMDAEEAARAKAEEERKKKGKRKGLGGLSAEKKKLLKKLIMQKAAEDLRNEAKQKAAEREKYINEKVPPVKTEGKGQAELIELINKLYQRMCSLEEDVYDWEIKIRKQDFEINELTLKVNDTKGKYIKPVLRKVNKTESKLKKLGLQQMKESTDFRGNLKSTGQNKYALEEDEPAEKNPHWRDELKPVEREEGAPADSETAAES
ncbi:unnamed protein product [Candidula unifasciata]|uniref:Troponin I n=1 Tax=Candidula unifasciata TaxID=100452 RepID=A0A8S3YX84_9EUPU|nr:unnamed protein product [Candidula unifasciata]